MKENTRIMRDNELGENHKNIKENNKNAWNWKKLFSACIKCLKLMLKHMKQTIFIQQQYTKKTINQFYGKNMWYTRKISC